MHLRRRWGAEHAECKLDETRHSIGEFWFGGYWARFRRFDEVAVWKDVEGLEAKVVELGREIFEHVGGDIEVAQVLQVPNVGREVSDLVVPCPS